MIEQVNKDIAEALKSGDKRRADALKMLKNSLLNAQKAKKDKIGQDEAYQIIRKEIKMRVEARDMYSKNDRQELADKEEYERNLFDNYIPAGLTEEQLNKMITQTADKLGGDLSFSTLMPEVIRQVAGRADGKTVAELVKKFIEGEQK